ncbi:serine/threonine-protein phosphatase 6 regulatory subunit 3-A [Scaptodrosophila lebanonensis]|uniref:Serine/threonine-protein phosphatase 6 regulatory subunit 3-A n=1 Tax=Drosophila lebanonensis TaxID=7225 RepID=A0A6J2UBQ0_DROLE|nr:serine/threonine-protein phosphatase 6 regulatory subunit 3-A [Scaptodrosophila lebanonensis]
MFWDKGYAPSANIEALLEKENTTLEEFLDEEDILQECKTQKKNLVNYFTRPEVIKRLVQLITTEPSEDVPMVQRFRYANMSCEILTLGLPSLDEKLLSDADTLQLLYSYLEKEPPLNPLLSSFFSKTFSMLFTKKPEQDWFLYQHMCLQLLEYIKSQKNFLDLICKHFDTPVIPDLIMQMMKDIEGGQLKRNLYEWLTEDKLVERLIAILRNPQETDKHGNVAEFFCDLINQGRSMRQTEQENDSFEPAFDGSNPILKTIESAETVEALLNVILEPNAVESAILSGISVVLTLIRPITFTDEPNSDRQRLLQKREREFHQEVQETVITVMAPRLSEFVHILKNPPVKPMLETTATVLTPPFGKTRLQVCRVFTALLETRHEIVQQAICATDYFSLLLEYFKQYCWNNFLHTELEKAMHIVFYNELSNNKTISTECNDMSYCKQMTSDDYIFNCFMKTDDDASDTTEVEVKNALNNAKRAEGGRENQPINDEGIEIETAAVDAASSVQNEELNDQLAREETEEMELQKEEEITEHLVEKETIEADIVADSAAIETTEAAINDVDKTKVVNNAPPTEMQTHLIVNCHLVSKLVAYWQHNAQEQAAEKGRRLGYMGHLIKILRHITNCISESEHIGALITTSLIDEAETKLWQSLIDAEDGEFTQAVKLQSKLLANCNPHEENEYNAQITKDFLCETSAWNVGALSYSNMGYNDLDGTLQDIVFNMDHDQNLFEFTRNLNDDDEDDDEHSGAGGGDGHGLLSKSSVTLNNLSADPWDMDVHFVSTDGNTGTESWGADFNSVNFADFDAHFSTLSSDLGMPSTQASVNATETTETAITSSSIDDEKQEDEVKKASKLSPDNAANDSEQAEYDNNANVEKTLSVSSDKANDSNDLSLASTTTATNIEATSIVSRLQSVLLDGEDDYEDDEGMWTKPLGRELEAEDEPLGPIVNGPSHKQVTEFTNASQNNDNNSSNNIAGDDLTNQHKLSVNVTAPSTPTTTSAAKNVEISTNST